MSDSHLLRRLGDPLSELVRAAAMDERARVCATGLAAVEERATQVAHDRLIHVGRGSDDARRLSPELKAHPLQGRRDIGDDLAANLGRSSERDLVDATMTDERLPDLGSPEQNLDDLPGNAGLAADLDEPPGRPDRLLRGLEDRGVARGKRWRELPCGDRKRHVPRRDECTDANRLARRVVHGVRDGDL
jgi:hypothetical protein